MIDDRSPLTPHPDHDAIALEHARLAHLIAGAARGEDLMQHIAYGTLFVDTATGAIAEANDAAAALLGYPLDVLIGVPIARLELHRDDPGHDGPRHPTLDADLYGAVYRHGSGQPLPLTVQRQQVDHEGQVRVMYRLIDRSLHGQVWYELRRREDDGFRFQQKLADINNLAVELSQIDSFDLLCRQAVTFGLERLGFDRLSLWRVDEASAQMRGTYGVDEAGALRDEREQSWFYGGTLVSGFITGALDQPFLYTESPLYNDRSQVIGFGWNLTVPLIHDRRCLGILTADNFRFRRPIRNYEPELLRLYALTLAHILALHESRQQAIALQLAHARTQLLEEFIRNIAHDFRNPLAVIRTNTYLIRQVNDPVRIARWSEEIDNRVEILSTALTRVKDMVRIQHGLTLTRAPEPIGMIVQSALLPLREMIARNAITLTVTGDEGAVVQADGYYLARALTEILDNAVRYSPQNGMVEVVCHQAEDGDAVSVTVRDSGPGMDAATLQRIFEPLFRADGARTERRSGVGLAIADAIVSAHGGAIAVHSAPGEGAAFTVTLPTA